GCRHYSNTSDPTFDSGFFHGDIAEALLFNRALPDHERAELDSYLQTKHAALLRIKALPPVPPMRVLAPGFDIAELPVKLSNINYLEYAPDGRLFALGYDGRVHVLRDTDGDGLEDRALSYWTTPPIQAPVSMAVRPEGVYVTANKKVSLLRDRNGDGVADEEETVVSGWPESDHPNHGGGVDCMAITFDRDGAMYFGVSTANYPNAYRLRDGRAHYDITSERGTILKLSPDRKRREIVCTGIRYPYTLAFNRHGDLFCTDQEGETWMPNGNPLDELNHIVPGRHYGFPPRHPVHLPKVIDEPPVVGFGPQHQSTCGMEFNETNAWRKSFGPAHWEGDALVAGYSRGKIWRAKLAKTPSGYVGREQLIVSARLLLTDIAVSPRGDLAIAAHSGGPDWGSGPAAMGRLFKVIYRDAAAPQVVAAWPSGPIEVTVAFDKPLLSNIETNLAELGIEYGEFVRAGDRFELHRPPYKVVQEQLQAFRGRLKISGAKLSNDRRNLILATDPHPFAANYALTIPGLGTKSEPADFNYDFGGVDAEWRGASGAAWKGWLPHADLAAARTLTASSSTHDHFWNHLEQGDGELHLRARLNVGVGEIFLRMESSADFSGALAGQHFKSAPDNRSRHVAHAKWKSESATAAWMDWQVQLKIRASRREMPEFTISFHTSNDPLERAVPLKAIFVPWTPATRPPEKPVGGAPPQLAGGHWERGREIFFGDQVKCAACHIIRGKGGQVGPDLSNLIHKDAASVWRDIAEPSLTINPDHVSFTVILKNGDEMSGLVRSESGDRLRIVNAAQTEGVTVARADVAELRPEALSIMPAGLDQILGPAGMRDLMTFLLHAEPPAARAGDLPPDLPKRTRAEIEALLTADPASSSSGVTANPQANTAPESPAEKKRLYVVLVAGPKDHGPGEHDYPAWQRNWSQWLGQASHIKISTAQLWPTWDQWTQADAVVFYFWNHDWSPQKLQMLDSFLARGGGVIVLHSATIMDRDAEQLAGRIGLSWQGGRCKFRHGPLDLKFIAPHEDPITRGFAAQVHFHDESYWPMIGDESKVRVLATTVEEGKDRPMIWTFEPGKGRVFCSILGHYAWTFDDPLFRGLFLRGLAWATRQPMNRFDELIRAEAAAR
ncbi:MAG: ThuA domain-containing protein, partial [Verrucomicrobiota bacterium]